MCCKQYMEWARFLEWHVEMSILLIVTLKVPAIRDCYNTYPRSQYYVASFWVISNTPLLSILRNGFVIQ